MSFNEAMSLIILTPTLLLLVGLVGFMFGFGFNYGKILTNLLNQGGNNNE